MWCRSGATYARGGRWFTFFGPGSRAGSPRGATNGIENPQTSFDKFYYHSILSLLSLTVFRSLYGAAAHVSVCVIIVGHAFFCDGVRRIPTHWHTCRCPRRAEIAIERRGRKKMTGGGRAGKGLRLRPGAAAVRLGNVGGGSLPIRFFFHVDSPPPPPILSRGKEKTKKVKSAVVGQAPTRLSPPGRKYRCAFQAKKFGAQNDAAPPLQPIKTRFAGTNG